MSRPIRIGVQLTPGGTPDYPTWREAVLHAEELGTDMIFGYDHFHAPRFADIVDAKPILVAVFSPPLVPTEGFVRRSLFGRARCIDVQRYSTAYNAIQPRTAGCRFRQLGLHRWWPTTSRAG